MLRVCFLSCTTQVVMVHRYVLCVVELERPLYYDVIGAPVWSP